MRLAVVRILRGGAAERPRPPPRLSGRPHRHPLHHPEVRELLRDGRNAGTAAVESWIRVDLSAGCLLAGADAATPAPGALVRWSRACPSRRATG
ncbi:MULTISPECIES: hypothetical protein [Streptomyces]|uniref:hypothetical protein n=1 Tax=Streptomyces TaxID=1883 RepID=UPI000ACF8F81|nr:MULTISPECIES: hypothetical protein [Streptomyces]MCH0556120.1 hypothetical protein [Streptomyces sp. MUM 16J]